MKKLLALSLALIVLLSMSAYGAEARAANEEEKAATASAATETDASAKEQAALAEIENEIKNTVSYCKVYSDNDWIYIDFSIGDTPSKLYELMSDLRDSGMNLSVFSESLETVREALLESYKKIKPKVEARGLNKELQINLVDDIEHDFIYLSVANDKITYDVYADLCDEEPESVATPKQTPKPTPKPTTTPTMGEKNALKKAHQYLDYSAFSYTRLIEQLEFEGFSHEEAVYAVDHCGADWNKQAVKKAKQYLDYSSFSRSGLIDQLIYEGFTAEQAEYGVTQNGY